nr:major facilitator superfamily domain-containing protein 6-like [Lytechinus pictus]
MSVRDKINKLNKCSLIVGVLLSGTSIPVVRWGVTLIITNYRVAFLAFALVASLSAVCSCFMDFKYTTCDWDTQWSELRRVLLSPHFASVFFVAFFTGVCNGSVWGFLLWHFQNIGASQTLIGVLEAIQSIAELILGYFSRRFLNYLGYITSLTLGLAVYAIRFVCYAAISNPLWLIPVEILHGISFLLTWTTLVSYLGTAVPAECMTTVQGILGALYFGLGVGAGSLVSGIIIDYFNAVKAFYGFAVASLAVMFLFMVSQQLFPRGSKFDDKSGYDDNGNDEEKQKLDHVCDDEAEEVITPTPPYPVSIKNFLQPKRTKNEQHLLSPGAGTGPIREMMPHGRFFHRINFADAHKEVHQIQQRPLSYCGTATSEMRVEVQQRALPVHVTVSLQQLKQLKCLPPKEKTLPNNKIPKEETRINATCQHETIENNWLLPRQRTYTIN